MLKNYFNVLMSLLPALDATDPIRQWIAEVNTSIQRMAKRQGVQVLNVHDTMLGEDAALRADYYTTDELHLSKDGYVALTDALLPALNAALSDAPARV